MRSFTPARRLSSCVIPPTAVPKAHHRCYAYSYRWKPRDKTDDPAATTPSSDEYRQETRQRHGNKRAGSRAIRDRLSRTNATLFTTLIDDLMPTTHLVSRRTRAAGDVPLGAHLVYSPLHCAPSLLAADGADGDHVPANFPLARDWDEWEGRVLPPPSGGEGTRTSYGKRLWAGGMVVFRDGWRDSANFRHKGVANWTCVESVHFETPDGGDGPTKSVDVSRRSGTSREGKDLEEGGQGWLINELRKLVFVPGPRVGPDGEVEDSFAGAESRIIKARHQATSRYKIRPPTGRHLFQFSALTFNAHFIHLDQEKGLVHGPLLLALMLRGLEHTILLQQRRVEDAQKQQRGQEQGNKHPQRRWEVKEIWYKNIRPARVNSNLVACVRRPGFEKRRDRPVEDEHAHEPSQQEDGVSKLAAAEATENDTTGPPAAAGEAKTQETTGTTIRDSPSKASQVEDITTLRHTDGGSHGFLDSDPREPEKWDVWIEAEDGGMVVKGTALIG